VNAGFFGTDSVGVETGLVSSKRVGRRGKAIAAMTVLSVLALDILDLHRLTDSGSID